jgi:nucleoid DNA-binding protein
LMGFGSFSVQTPAAPTRRQTPTGQDPLISARKAPKVSAGQQLREAVTSSSQA